VDFDIYVWEYVAYAEFFRSWFYELNVYMDHCDNRTYAITKLPLADLQLEE